MSKDTLSFFEYIYNVEGIRHKGLLHTLKPANMAAYVWLEDIFTPDELVNILPNFKIGTCAQMLRDKFSFLFERFSKERVYSILKRSRVKSDHIDIADMIKHVSLPPKWKPKTLDEIHDYVVNLYNQRNYKQRDFKRPDARKWEGLKIKDMVSRVPDTNLEVLSYGQRLKNCVFSYTDRHARGELTLIFLLDKDRQPKWAIELDKHGNLVQMKGTCNKDPEESFKKQVAKALK